MPEQIPSQIGRYRIVGVLHMAADTIALPLVGEDAVSRGVLPEILYHARDEVMHRDVTIKILSPTALAEADARQAIELRQRFYREAKMGLAHPNVISVLDLCEDLGISYIVFEALEGRTLQEALEAGISLRVGLPILLQVLDGLAYVHAKGIIHRDIKPDNIMVCRTGVVKIMNFGIARAVDSTLTRTGSVMGTPSWMSPEQASGYKIDGRSDIFSLGVILYELVTRRRPFTGDTLPSVMFAIIKEDPDMTLIPDGPEWTRLRGVIARALQKKREDRYPDALAMRKDLELALKELGDSADWTAPREAAETRLH